MGLLPTSASINHSTQGLSSSSTAASFISFCSVLDSRAAQSPLPTANPWITLFYQLLFFLGSPFNLRSLSKLLSPNKPALGRLGHGGGVLRLSQSHTISPIWFWSQGLSLFPLDLALSAPFPSGLQGSLTPQPHWTAILSFSGAASQIPHLLKRF